MDDDYLLQVIQQIADDKDKKHIASPQALREEIMGKVYADMRRCLERLLKADKIEYSRTLNSWAVGIKS